MNSYKLYHFLTKCEMDWVGDKLIVWVSLSDLAEFVSLIGYDYLCESGMDVNLRYDSIAFDILELLEYAQIEPEDLRKKEKDSSEEPTVKEEVEAPIAEVSDSSTRTMEFAGMDFWSRPIYKCIETGILWKDINCGDHEPDLHSCQNQLDGEPEYRISPNLNIVFKTKYENKPNGFTYQLLDRLRSDCDYYLGDGNRYAKRLWANDEQGQIDKMKELYDSLPNDQKPEWLTYEQILSYEKQMVIK